MRKDLHMAQKRRITKQMNSSEFWKVALSGCLLFFICVVGLLPANPKVTQLTKEGETISYPFYDRSTKKASFHPKEIYHRKLSLWIKDSGHKAIIICIAFLWLLRADFKQLGIDLTYMWIFFFILMFFDHVLFRSRLNWGFDIEIFLMSIQTAYTFYCLYLWKYSN